MDPSYPFLAFAREHGLAYGLVLAFVDAYHKRFDRDKLDFWEKKAKSLLQHTMTGNVLLHEIEKERLRQNARYNK